MRRIPVLWAAATRPRLGLAATPLSRGMEAAHANDGGGSIRIPASECGLVGLKPSRGRTSFGPAVGAPVGGLVSDGVVTRSVRDTVAILDVLAGASSHRRRHEPTCRK